MTVPNGIRKLLRYTGYVLVFGAAIVLGLSASFSAWSPIIGYLIFLAAFTITMHALLGWQNDGSEFFCSPPTEPCIRRVIKTTKVTAVPYESESVGGPELKAAARGFTYSPLPHGHIRLLRVYPLSPGAGELKCTISAMPLTSESEQDYIALSYTWDGGATKDGTKTVFIDGQPLEISTNLFNIIRRIRDLDQTKSDTASDDLVIWVDAICIDQSNWDERSRQVLRMRAIYASARLVLAALDMPQEMSERISKLTEIIEPTLSTNRQAPELYDLLQDGATIEAVKQLYEQNYWNRIWIIQEFAIGNPLKLLLHNSTVSAERLSFVLELLPTESRPPESNPISLMLKVRRTWQKEQRLSLTTLLWSMSAFESKYRIDRVFGILGLVKDDMKFLREPNYNIGCDQWSLRMTKSYIAKHGLNIILLSSGPKKSTRGIPSWCPDYFRFDEHRPQLRAVRLFDALDSPFLSASALPTRRHRGAWLSTGHTMHSVEFINRSLWTVARRLGPIRSLGSAWFDSTPGAYPKHDELWARSSTQLEIAAATRTICRAFKGLYNLYYGVSKRSQRSLYSRTHMFHPKHEKPGNAEDSLTGISRWISVNRNFRLFGSPLHRYAAQIPFPQVYLWHQLKQDLAFTVQHPTNSYISKALVCSFYILGFLVPSLQIWPPRELSSTDKAEVIDAAQSDMRLMCLDDTRFGVGWAAVDADLGDEVFLIPGCSVPVILRPDTVSGTYTFVGDAIVIGAMYNEVWEETTPNDLTRIEIV